MKPMLHKEHIEQLMDTYGLRQLLDTIADIAGEKAQHIQENWQDKPLAKHWERASSKIASVAANSTITSL